MSPVASRVTFFYSPITVRVRPIGKLNLSTSRKPHQHPPIPPIPLFPHSPTSPHLKILFFQNSSIQTTDNTRWKMLQNTIIMRCK